MLYEVITKIVNYVRDDEFILYDVEVQKDEELPKVDSTFCLQKSGPREKIYFNPRITSYNVCYTKLLRFGISLESIFSLCISA